MELLFKATETVYLEEDGPWGRPAAAVEIPRVVLITAVGGAPPRSWPGPDAVSPLEEGSWRPFPVYFPALEKETSCQHSNESP
jgi:hypothetical protein